MHAEQISVFLENKAGRLCEVTGVLSEAQVNIRALALADTSDFGVLRLIVDDTEKAKTALKTAGFTVGKTDVLAVEVPDRPGGLHEILDLLQSAGINVEYMYAFVNVTGENAVMIFRFDETEKAITTLQEKGFKILDGQKVYSL
ncbi:MAG: ACT domain-containing protein [Desulfobacterales bacterium]|nr:ACT domain-containing protein [Desulfobacterales bacterium]